MNKIEISGEKKHEFEVGDIVSIPDLGPASWKPCIAAMIAQYECDYFQVVDLENGNVYRNDWETISELVDELHPTLITKPIKITPCVKES